MHNGIHYNVVNPFNSMDVILMNVLKYLYLINIVFFMSGEKYTTIQKKQESIISCISCLYILLIFYNTKRVFEYIELSLAHN